MDASAETPIDGEAIRIDAAWGAKLQAAVCERCDWAFLAPTESLPQLCPHCFQAQLTRMAEGVEQLPYIHPPELLLPFTLPAERLGQAVQAFAQGIPYAPPDLAPKDLQGRLRRIYLPMWLVDAQVKAIWQAEAGFDYEVVSHQDHFDDHRGGWSSNEVKEGRVRWEPRLGRLSRSYTNISAPALDEHASLRRAVGDFEAASAQPFQAEALSAAFVRLPNRPPKDAWSDATLAFQAAAAEECRQAASADHMRQFSWQPDYQNPNWTLQLLPLYATYYKDDEGKPQPVLVHGQSGRINGVRRASMARGRQAALMLLGVAVVIFLISLVVSLVSIALPPLLVLGVIGMVAALLVGLGAIYPVSAAWWFNRQQENQ